MAVLQDDHVFEGIVDSLALVRELHPLRRGIADGGCVWRRIVEGLVGDRRALRGVADTDTGESSQDVVSGILVTGLGLAAPGRDLSHHLLSDHADLVDHDQTQIAHLLLEAQQRGAAFGELAPLPWIAHLEEAVQCLCGESDVERGDGQQLGRRFL